MLATDAIALLLAAFETERVGTDGDGAPEYDLNAGFPFVATEIGDTLLRLTAPLPDLAPLLRDRPGTALRLLAATLQGVETGAGQIGIHPALGPALIEVIDTATLDDDGMRLRFVDFSLHVEYWRIEALPGLAGATPAPASSASEIFIRL